MYMRAKLKSIGSNQRHKYSGKFVKYGFKYDDRRKEHAKPTLILKDITLIDEEKEELIADHLWLNLTVGFKKLGVLCKDEIVSFNGRVAPYKKGYYTSSQKVDYKLRFPTKVALLEPMIDLSQRKLWPDNNWEICNDIYEMYEEDYLKRDIGKPYPER